MSNILNKQCNASVYVPNANLTPLLKRERYSWSDLSDSGVFMMIKKEDLNIDGSYQREEVSKQKLRDIARDWDWKLFGALSVVKRSDGTFWVYDGGHRCRSAFLRDDINELPCMVFEAKDEKTEAKAFIGTNTMKSMVSAYHKYRASVVIGEDIAIAAQAILKKSGYFPKKGAVRSYDFAAISTLLDHVKEDRVLAEKAFSACAEVAQDGEPFSGEVLEAMFGCQKRLGGKADIFSGIHLDRLKKESIAGIESAIRREKHILGKGGEAILAKALLDVLNKGKKRRLTFD